MNLRGVVEVGTLGQFARRLREDFFTRNPDAAVTRTEYDRLYPASCRELLWWNEIEHLILAGHMIGPRTLDALCKQPGRYWYRMMHDYERAIPPGYMPPAIRKQNRAYAAELRAARKRGRLASGAERQR